jgi:hypothetical protein
VLKELGLVARFRETESANLNVQARLFRAGQLVASCISPDAGVLCYAGVGVLFEMKKGSIPKAWLPTAPLIASQRT